MTQTNTTGDSPAGVDASDPTSHSRPDRHLPMLLLGALGVVYGDIGTSPLYAFRDVRIESWSKFVSEAYWNVELEK